MMITSKKAFIVVFILVSCLITAETFVAKKKKKGPSLSALKEQYATISGDLIKQCAHLNKQIASIQEKLITSFGELLEGRNDGLFAHATKQQLESDLERLQEFTKRLSEFDLFAGKTKSFLKNTPSKKIIS